MASPKGLNPRAPRYIPISHRTSSVLQHNSTIYIPSTTTTTTTTFSPPSLPLYYHHPPSPPPPSDFLTFSTLFYEPHPLLHTTSFTTEPQNPHFFQPPPPPLGAAPPTSQPQNQFTEPVTATDQEAQVVEEVVSSHEKLRYNKAPRFGGIRRKGLNREESAGKGHSCRRERKKEGFDLPKKKTIDRVLHLKREEEKTTVMIKNIPNEFTRAILVNILDKHCMSENQKAENTISKKADEAIVSAFDFLYLPMDFGTGYNKGYAFVNFTDPRAVWKFFYAFNDRRWDCVDSPKICEIVCAKIQGKEAMIKHFEKSIFACESLEFLPICFNPPRNGSKELVELNTIGEHHPMPYWGAKSHTT